MPWANQEQFLSATATKSAIAMGQCSWSGMVNGWVVHVKYNPCECQESRFPSRALHCNGINIVFHFTCPFNVADRCLCL